MEDFLLLVSGYVVERVLIGRKTCNFCKYAPQYTAHDAERENLSEVRGLQKSKIMSEVKES